MPKRPRSHQLEEESIYNLGIVLPKNWLMSRSDKDYGIDGQIEIFNENNESTGLIFFFQLKATDSHLIKTIQNYRIKTNTILYYLDLPIPVLLLRYSSCLKQFYYKWAHSIDFYYQNPSSKTINIEFKKWSQEQTPLKIIKYLIFYNNIIKNPENVDIDFYFDMPEEELFLLAKGEIFNHLKKAFKELSRFMNISINSKNKDSFSRIEIKNNTLSINIGEISGFNIHHLNRHYSSLPFKKYIIDDILFGIFYSILRINHNNIAINPFRKYLFRSSIVKLEGMVNLDIIIILLRINRLGGLGSLYRIIKSNNDINICHTLFIYLLFQEMKYSIREIKKIREITAYSENILKEKNSSLKELSTIFYNLGSILSKRSKNEKNEAIKYYKKAAKNNPDYFKRPYFWKEQAGIYFSLGYYKTSELYYKHSLKLGSPNSVLGLRANALMFCGEYKNSYVLFCEYLNKLDNQKDANYCEFCLKSKFLNTVIKNFKIENQKRQPIKAENVFSLNVDSLSLKKIEEAFNYDLLCNIAWYNNGSLELKKNNFSEALISFLFAALLDQSDLESWGMFVKINTLHKFNNKLFICGLKIAYHYHSDNLLEDLIKWVRNIPDKELTERQKIKLINSLSEIINEISEERKEEKILRFSLPDGKHIEYNL
jgi:tetratricopeptide (TPR) repeat protein